MGDIAGAPVLPAAADEAGPEREEPFLDWAWTEAIEATELLRSVLAALGLHDGFPRLRGDVNVYGAPMVTVGRITPAAARRLAAALGRLVAGSAAVGDAAAEDGAAGGGAVSDGADPETGGIPVGSAVASAVGSAVGAAVGATAEDAPGNGRGGPDPGVAGRLDGFGALGALAVSEAFGAGPGALPGQGGYAMRLPA